jgi:hypothetical protein
MDPITIRNLSLVDANLNKSKYGIILGFSGCGGSFNKFSWT